MRKGLFFLILVVGIFFVLSSQDPGKSFVKINNQKVLVERADTPSKREMGLSERSSLPQDHGMIFLFDNLGLYPFWMKGMKFNLDFVFVANDRVVKTFEDVKYPQGNEEPIIIDSDTMFDKVIEVNAGTIKRMNIKKGDLVKISMVK